MAFAATSAESRRATAWVAPAAGAVAGVLVACGIWTFGGTAASAAPGTAAPATPAQAAAAIVPADAPAAPRHRPPTLSAPGAGAAQPASSPPLQLCGLGDLTTGHPPAEPTGAAGLQGLPRPLGEDALDAARAALLARLHQGDAAARATAALLERPPAGDPAAEQAWSTRVLAQAWSSASPTVLQWAEQACALQPEPAACRRALIRTRLQLEPDNAAHWVALGAEDPMAAEEAWQGLLRASRWHERPAALSLAVEAAAPAPLPGYLRAALEADIRQRALAWPSRAEGFVLERCEQAPPGRADTCAALATLMSEHSDSLDTLTEAASVARAAGWPDDRVQRLHDDFQALHRAAQSLRQPPDPGSCRQVQDWQQHLADVGRLGEPAALRTRALPGPASPR